MSFNNNKKKIIENFHSKNFIIYKKYSNTKLYKINDS